MSEPQKKKQVYYHLLDTLNIMTDENPIYTDMVKRIVLMRRNMSSVYWSLSTQELSLVESTLDGVQIANPLFTRDDPVTYSVVDVLKDINSLIYLELELMDVDIKVMIEAYVIAMEKSVRPVGTANNVLEHDEVKDRLRCLMNAPWLFTLCLLEVSSALRDVLELNRT